MDERLKKLLKNSYVPLSGFRVAAIVADDKGRFYEGVNIENPSFKSGLCAEQVAIAAAVADGVKKGELKVLYLLTDSDTAFGTPCFLCREVMSELFAKDARIICYNKNDLNSYVYSIKSLCPHPFEEVSDAK